MPHPNHSNSNGNILQRQPRLSLLGRDEGTTEKDVNPWNTKGRQQQRQLQRPTSLGKDAGAGALDRQLDAAVKETTLANRERIYGDHTMWHVVADVLDDVSKPTEPDSSEGVRVATHSSAPHASPHHWVRHLSSSTARRSSEWETETLLDQSRNLDLDMALHMYPCPFRKRNPARFNIRDHEGCARAPFDSIHRLKHHIVTHHGRAAARHQCRRCKQQFETEWALEAHLLLPRDQMCDVNLSFHHDPEDGIVDETVRILAARDAPEETWTWDGIWRLVFSGDLEVPDPDFQPVAELVEVEQAFDDGQELLKECLREKLQLLVPGAINHDYLSFLTGQVELVFETHRVNVMKKSLARSWATTVSGQPPEARPVEPSRKSNRISRRSTLLQTLQRTASASTGGPTSHKHSRTSNITKQQQANRLSREQFRLCTLEPHTTANNIPLHPNHHHSIPNPRDSCDSGISMPCETCDTEPCNCCSEAAASSSCYTNNTNTNTNNDDNGQIEFTAHLTNPRRQQQPQQPSSRRHQHHHLRQPRLSIDTNIADVRLLNSRGAQEQQQHFSSAGRGRGGGEVLSLSSAGGVNGGRFSPESFKQRVLRRQLVGS